MQKDQEPHPAHTLTLEQACLYLDELSSAESHMQPPPTTSCSRCQRRAPAPFKSRV